MSITIVDDLGDPRLAAYRNVPDPVLLRDLGVFVAEGRLVVATLLRTAAADVESVLVSPAACDAMRDEWQARPDVPVYVAPLGVLTAVVGFNLHRGCLAIGRRPASRPVADVMARLADASLILAAERVANADNIGALFRNARAFGAAAVILSPGCCDPLYRKALRVSVGASLRLPFAVARHWPDDLGAVRAAGFEIAALTPRADAEALADFLTTRPARVALVVGHEGEGLSDAVLARADRRVRIDMVPTSDSVNVATAAAIALHACRTAGG